MDETNTAITVENAFYTGNEVEPDVEVIYDDRDGIRGGQMFADADLIGVPIRVVVSPRNLKEGKVEISTRDKSVSMMVDVAEAGARIRELIEKLFAEINQ